MSYIIYLPLNKPNICKLLEVTNIPTNKCSFSWTNKATTPGSSKSIEVAIWLLSTTNRRGNDLNFANSHLIDKKKRRIHKETEVSIT